jgi:hypothetical protein
MAIERGRWLPVLLLAVVSAVSVGADRPDFPSTEEIQKLVDSQQYTTALRDLQRVLALNGAAANAYDRYKLLMMRGECELQLRQQGAAVESLKAAKAEAFKQSKPERAEDPIALIFLIQKSAAYQYVPKAVTTDAAGEGGEGGGVRANRPIPILDRIRRAEALRALLIDEFPSVEKKVAGLTSVKTLAPVLEVAKSAGTLHALEYARTRDDQQTAPLTHSVAVKGAALLDQALIDSSVRVEAIGESAQQIVIDTITVIDQNTHQPSTTQRTRRRGLSGRDVEYLKTVAATCDKISAATLELEQTLDADFETLNVPLAKAEAMKLRLNALLTDDYWVVPPQ